jgi:hypothetical protein
MGTYLYFKIRNYGNIFKNRNCGTYYSELWTLHPVLFGPKYWPIITNVLISFQEFQQLRFQLSPLFTVLHCQAESLAPLFSYYLLAEQFVFESRNLDPQTSELLQGTKTTVPLIMNSSVCDNLHKNLLHSTTSLYIMRTKDLFPSVTYMHCRAAEKVTE